MTYTCVSKLTIIGRDNGLSPGRHQAIIWTNTQVLSIRSLGTNFSEILSRIQIFSFKKMHLNMSSAKWRQFSLGLNVLTVIWEDGLLTFFTKQATGLDAWPSRVKCPARFVSYLHKTCICIWVVYSFCLFCCLFIIVRWWYVWCIEWASGNQEEVQACLVTLWLFIISCYNLYKTTLGLLCSWFENNPYFHKYSTDFHV